MNNMFIHLHVHSYYSLLYGTNSVKEIVKKAAEQGYKSLALTDINNLYGIHDFLSECKKNGVRPIIGAEVKVEKERAVILVKNRNGFKNLSSLITAVKKNRDMPFSKELKEYSSDNIIMTDSESLLRDMHGNVETLYAMVTPFSRAVVNPARKAGIPLIATGDATMLCRADYNIHKVLQAIAKQSSVSAIEDETCISENSILFTREEAHTVFSDLPDALSNTIKAAGQCHFNEIFDGFIFPSFETEGFKKPADQLREATYKGAEKRYGELSETVIDRIEYELSIIESKGFSSYFLVVADIAQRASRTCGRGSGAASIVSYSLGITNVDPIKYNLYFERFLNHQRSDPPDIDIDFAWDERDALIEEIMEKYGYSHSAMVCTLIHFRKRSAIRDVARTYGIPENEITVFEKKFLKMKEQDIEEVWREILTIAFKIIGFPKHLSVHVGGLVITPQTIWQYVPVEKSAKKVPIITWDKDGAEAAGLVKIDLLGNRSLAVIRDALCNLEENGIVINPLSWNPAEDKKTCQLIAKGDTIGVFYVESPAMRQLQKKTGVGDYEHLIIHSSIIRPAANRFINEYVDRLKGKIYEPLHPSLDYILKETYGIMCYQEDVSKVAIALADFTPAEADGLRKILSKKNKEEKLKKYKEMFFENSHKNNVPDNTIKKIWEMICSFDGYSFCKPHSASYAMVSYQSAYIKAHYPAEFIAAVLSNRGGYYTASAYISEAKRFGLKILPPDINESHLKYWGRRNAIRVGLMALSKINFHAIHKILQERELNGEFTDIRNFLSRVHITQADCEILVHTGVLDSIADGMDRSQLHWSILLTLRSKKQEYEAQLFHDDIEQIDIPETRKISEEDKKKYEYNNLGFLCDRHPLYFWKKAISQKRRLTARDIPKHMGRCISIVGWLVTRKSILTIKGQPMEFVSFEDETAIFETVFFPDVYKKYFHLLSEKKPLLITGKVDNDRGAENIQVSSLSAL